MQPFSFLQSKEWEIIQQSLGRKTWRLEDILVIKHDLPGGFNYLYLPHADLQQEEIRVPIKEFYKNIEDIASLEKSIFLKIEPLSRDEHSIDTRVPSKNLQPQKTTILDLSQTEEELLRVMHPKTRYNIRLAKKHGVIVAGDPLSSSSQDFTLFFSLLQKTAKRDNFSLHDKKHYQALLHTKSPDFSNELFLSTYNGEILASALVNFYRKTNTATYLHGASSTEHRFMMAPYLLHWHIIEEAKKRSFLRYDFWGVDENQWPGMTRFKMGFGGEILCRPQAYDKVYRPRVYVAYQIAKKFLS